jgi:hypothetical protein
MASALRKVRVKHSHDAPGSDRQPITCKGGACERVRAGGNPDIPIGEGAAGPAAGAVEVHCYCLDHAHPLSVHRILCPNDCTIAFFDADVGEPHSAGVEAQESTGECSAAVHGHTAELHLATSTLDRERAAVCIESLAVANGAAAHGDGAVEHVDATAIVLVTSGLAVGDQHLDEQDLATCVRLHGTPQFVAGASRDGAADHFEEAATHHRDAAVDI